MSKICQKCKYVNSDSYDYCTKCGSSLSANFNNNNNYYNNNNNNLRTCPNCHAVVDTNSNFCTNCGSSLSANFNNNNNFNNNFSSRTCPNCHAVLNANSSFCSNCGSIISRNNDSGSGKNAVLPRELEGLNWGGFFLNFWWGLAHNVMIVWLGLIPFVGFIIPFVLLFSGNKYAWQNRRFKSYEEFKTVQKRWANMGIIFFIIGLILSIISIIIQIAVESANSGYYY